MSEQCRWCTRWFSPTFQRLRHEKDRHKLEYDESNGVQSRSHGFESAIMTCPKCKLPILQDDFNKRAHTDNDYCRSKSVWFVQSDNRAPPSDEDDEEADLRPDSPIFDDRSRQEAKLDDAEDASSQPAGQETGTSSVGNGGASSDHACRPLSIEQGRVVLLSIVSKSRHLKAQSALPTGTVLPKNFTGLTLYRLHEKSLPKSERTAWRQLDASDKEKWTQLASDSSDVDWDFFVVHESAVETGRHEVDMDAAVVLFKARHQSFDTASSSSEKHAVLNVTAKEVWLNAHWLSDKDVQTCGTVSSFTHRRPDLDCIFVSGPAPSKTRPRSATSAATAATTELSSASSFVMVACVDIMPDIVHWSSLTSGINQSTSSPRSSLASGPTRHPAFGAAFATFAAKTRRTSTLRTANEPARGSVSNARRRRLVERLRLSSTSVFTAILFTRRATTSQSLPVR
jgi:hypothetical protein